MMMARKNRAARPRDTREDQQDIDPEIHRLGPIFAGRSQNDADPDESKKKTECNRTHWSAASRAHPIDQDDPQRQSAEHHCGKARVDVLLGPVARSNSENEQKKSDDRGVFPFAKRSSAKTVSVKDNDSSQKQNAGEEKASSAHQEYREVDDGELYPQVGPAPGEIDIGKAQRQRAGQSIRR